MGKLCDQVDHPCRVLHRVVAEVFPGALVVANPTAHGSIHLLVVWDHFQGTYFNRLEQYERNVKGVLPEAVDVLVWGFNFLTTQELCRGNWSLWPRLWPFRKRIELLLDRKRRRGGSPHAGAGVPEQ